MNQFSIFCSCLLVSIGLATAHGFEKELERQRLDQTATAITIIFDTSGSMDEDGKMTQAKQAFSQWIESIPDDYTLGLIDFYVGKGRVVVPLGDGNHGEILKHVKQASPRGRTPIVHCLGLALGGIQERREQHSPYERHVVVVFTDGKETGDKRGVKAVRPAILKLRNQIIEVVGIGFHGEGDYMKGATTKYFEANNSNELLAGLAQVDAELADDAEVVVTEADLDLIEKTKIPVPPAPAS